MHTFEEDVERVNALSPFRGNCTVGWGEEGGGDVYRIWDMLFLFSVPQYGGEPRFEASFHISGVVELVATVHSWT